MPTLKERVEGGLVGLLVGDALGVPYEFHHPADIPPLHEIEFTPPPDFHRAHIGVPPGTWSDDGAQALILLASLLDCGKLDAEDFGRGLVEWYNRGYMAVDGKVFDVGIQTARAINQMRGGVAALKAGGTDEQANGNGSLMRVLPLALWHRGTDAELVADAHTQSRVTHGHLRSQVCCALYCLWARRTLQEAADPWKDAVEALRQIYGGDSLEFAELEFHVRPDDPPEGQGSGYVVDCLRSARWVMQAGDYEQVVKAAVSLGRDTDTTACVAGGMAGIRDGINGIPKRWRDALRGRDILEPYLRELLAQ
ncbi:MAG TPA: ADP-ribosylglycohydrolase family protein [Blastocatellia bacterium]|nr:ADP-ribosylglycohydrolase family protein [Blastocatellia bacterium]